MKIYKFLAAVFWWYRQYCIPNPFEVLGDEITLTIDSYSFQITPEILNIVADPIVFWITYQVVGLYYRARTCPARGSILYMLFYCIHIVGIYFILSLYPTMWLMFLVVILYLAIHILVLCFKNRLSYA